MPTTIGDYGWRVPVNADAVDIPGDMARLGSDISDTLVAQLALKANVTALDILKVRSALLGVTANDNTTWYNDTTLATPMSSGTWQFDAEILSHCTDNALDLSVGFYGHDSVVSWAWHANRISATSADDATSSGMVWQTNTTAVMPNTQFVNVGTGTWVGATRIAGVINVTGPATVGLRFKKATAGSAVINVMHGSWIRFTKAAW